MRRTSINIGIALLTLIICFLIAEGAVRVFSIDRCQVADFRSARSRDFYRFTEEPRGILYEHIPGVAGELHGTQVKINSYGMRGAEVAEKKSDDIFRIAVLGDSVAFGYGISEEDSFPRILEKKINAESKIPAEVLNFSVTGYSSIQEYLVLVNKMPRFAPDMVIIAHHLNDIYNPGGVAIAPSHIKSFIASHSRLLGCFKLWHQLETRFIEGDQFEGGYAQAYEPSSPIWIRHKDLIGWFGKISREVRKPFVFVLLPVFENLDESYLYTEAHKALEEAIVSEGLKVVDLSPGEAAYEHPASFYRLDPGDPDHPNTAGHEKLAELIYEELLEQGLLPN